MNWCKMVICFSKYLPGKVLWKFIWFRVEEGTKSWMESEMPDNCHQKSFPITCQAFWVLRLLLLRQNQNLDTVSRVPKDDSNEMIWVGIPIVFVFVPGWGPMESQSKKNTQSSRIFKPFQHLWGQRCATEWNVQPNTLHKGLSQFICSGAWPTMAFSRGGGKKTCLALWVGCKEASTQRRFENGGGEWVTVSYVKKKFLLKASPTLSLSFPSHTGSLLSVWCWLAQRKRNPRLKGQESHEWRGRIRGGQSQRILTSLDMRSVFPRKKFLSPCAPVLFLFMLLLFCISLYHCWDLV